MQVTLRLIPIIEHISLAVSMLSLRQLLPPGNLAPRFLDWYLMVITIMASRINISNKENLEEHVSESVVVQQLEEIMRNLPKDGPSRQKLYVAAQDLVLALEMPVDHIRHILDIVCLPLRHLKMIADSLNSHYKSQYLDSPITWAYSRSLQRIWKLR